MRLGTPSLEPTLLFSGTALVTPRRSDFIVFNHWSISSSTTPKSIGIQKKYVVFSLLQYVLYNAQYNSVTYKSSSIKVFIKMLHTGCGAVFPYEIIIIGASHLLASTPCAVQVPTSLCSPECPVGHMKKQNGVHKCCFTCEICPNGTYMNSTGK